MKILWCIVFYLVFNDFLAIESKLQSENEDTNPLMNLMQNKEALEKMFNKNLQIQDKNFGALKTLFEESIEINNKRFGALEKLIEERVGALEKLHEKNVERVDCGEKCAQDESCVSVFWSNSSDSECRFNQNKNTIVRFVPGELYYCKDCQTTLDLVFEAENAGVIKLTNVATNKTTQSSSYANAMSDPSKAVDGDLDMWFSSEALLTEGKPWLMVDLGQRFLVAQIKIHERTKPIHKTTGGYFQVCVVNDFDKKVNPCNQHSEILKVNRRLRGYSELLNVTKVIMGRYVVVQNFEEQVLEIAELEVLSVIPIISYKCISCLAESNTVCDESKIPPVCSCAENHLPVDGDARNGCKDPCIGFKDRNTICHPVSYEEHSCECKKGHFEIFKEDSCSGCLNPCINFREQNSLCLAKDAIRYNCSCEQGFIPIHDNQPCQGCKKVCPSSLGYKNYRDFGCLKEHKTGMKWEDARSSCISEGGDLFSPGDKLPILPKDEMNLGSSYHCWIGIRRRGNGPYERVASGQKLADDSKLWLSAIGEPNRGSQECVVYSINSGLLFDNPCTTGYYFICQIKF